MLSLFWSTEHLFSPCEPGRGFIYQFVAGQETEWLAAGSGNQVTSRGRQF